LETWQQGAARQRELVDASVASFDLWQSESETLREALQGLEADRDEKKNVAEDARAKLPKEEAPSVELQGLRGKVKKAEEVVASKQKELDALRASLAKLEGEEAAERQAKPVVVVEATGELPPPPAVPEEGGETLKVSEYAKWMEGGADSGLAPAPPTPAEAKQKPPPPPVVAAEAEFAGAGAARAEEAPEITANRDAEERWAEARQLAQEAKHRLRGLEAVTHEGLTAEFRALASLLDTCVVHAVGKFSYSVCFFRNATQDTDSEKGVSLGRWMGWDFAQASPRALFARGAACGNGVRRKLSVSFECGDELRFLSVAEPLSCVYKAEMAHPAACNTSAAPGPEVLPPRRPKDEL